ncbi:MAG: B12-binding domain-containing radical SAM protein [Candidatus Geothermarchaeales archaeon]
MEHAKRVRRSVLVPSTSVGYLSEMLVRNGIKSWVLDLHLGYSMEEVRSFVDSVKPDLIGVSIASTYRHDLGYGLVKALRKMCGAKIVVGGPHISIMGAKVLEECDADFAVKFEGEYPLLELCQGVSLDRIKNLIYREDGAVLENESRDFIRNLDAIPFPRYGMFEMERYSDTIPIISSRGCPYQCTFCTTGSMGKIFRARSAENVVDELEYWYRRGYRVFDILDDNFTLDKDRVYQICDIVEDRGLKELELKTSNGVRADRTDLDLLRRMKQIGFKYICFGVEAGNDRILRVIKKGQTIEETEQAIKNACSLGYEVGLFFMVGHPFETPRDVEDSIRLALKYPVALAKFLNVIPYPGSELFEWVEKNDYFVGDWHHKLAYSMHLDGEPFFATPEMPLDMRRRLLEETAKVSIEVRKRNVKRKLRERYGTLGGIVADLLYVERVHDTLWRAYNENGAIRRAIEFAMKMLHVKVYHF